MEVRGKRQLHCPGSALVELHFMLTREQFKALLEEVQGVTEVQWHTTKTSQGNVGNHYS